MSLRSAQLNLCNTLCRGRQIALDIVRGLVFMHSKSMVHLDLKTSNSNSPPSCSTYKLAVPLLSSKTDAGLK